MNYLPNNAEEISLLKFIAKFQYLSVNDAKYFFSTSKYYRKRITRLVKENYLRRESLVLTLDFFGTKYIKQQNAEYYPIHRNPKYMPRLLYISNLGAYYNNCDILKFIPALAIKDKEVYTVKSRKYVGLFEINGIDYLTYHITNEHDNKYIKSVIYDIQKEQCYDNIIILYDAGVKLNKNDFNKIVYVEYEDIFKKPKPEIDFLYDYSKILGSENSDPKIIQWQLANLDRLFKYGIDISLLKKRNNQQNLGIYKMSSIVENISYRLQKHGKLAPSIDIARVLPKRDEDLYQVNEEEEDEEEINIENEDINSKNENNSNSGLLNEAPLNNNSNNEVKNIKIINDDNEIQNNNIVLNLNESEKEKPEEKNENNNKENENNENKVNIDLNKKTANNQNVYEDNFYDKNDPFIDDDLDNNSSEENELLYKLTLGYGNFTEQDILNNLKKNTRTHSLKKKKKMKNLKGKKSKDKDKGKKSPNKKEKKRLGNKVLLLNKTKRKNDEEKETTNKKKKKININIDSIDNLNKEKIEEIFASLKTECDSDLDTDHDKESFLRRNIKIFEEIYKKNTADFISVLSSKFGIDNEKTLILMEYEFFKSILENKYSNLSKFLNKLYTLLKENGVMELNTKEQLDKYIESVPEIGKSLNHISDNIVNYRDKFNSYMGKHYLDMSLINEKLENFIPNIKERNNEYLTKISAKFKEYEEKFKIKLNKDLIVSFIKNKYPNADFTEDLNSDINNRKFSLESFIVYDVGIKIKVFLQEEKNKIEIEKIDDNCVVDIDNKKVEIDLKNNNQENIVNNIDNTNQNNENINTISNSSKIFQSLKMNENKLKIFSSKIKVNEGQNEGNQLEQNQLKFN